MKWDSTGLYSTFPIVPIIKLKKANLHALHVFHLIRIRTIDHLSQINNECYFWLRDTKYTHIFQIRYFMINTYGLRKMHVLIYKWYHIGLFITTKAQNII